MIGKENNEEIILEVLANDMRRKIYNFIVKNPASHLRKIKRELDISMNTVMWHLKVLEDANLIKSKKFGNKLHYFHSKISEEEYIKFLLEGDEKIADIINYLQEKREEYLIKIAKETDLHPKTLRHYLDKLEALGIIKSKDKKQMQYVIIQQ